MNPPTMITAAGITLCPEHAAAWLRGGTRSQPATPAELNGRGCHACESDAFVSSDQVVTSLIREAVDEYSQFSDVDRPLFPLEFVTTKRVGRRLFTLRLEDGSEWCVSVAPMERDV